MNTALTQGGYVAHLQSPAASCTKKSFPTTTPPSSTVPSFGSTYDKNLSLKTSTLRGSCLLNETNNTVRDMDDDYASFSSSNLPRLGGVNNSSRDFLMTHYSAFSTSYDAFFMDDMDTQSVHETAGFDSSHYFDGQRFEERVDGDNDFFRSNQTLLQEQQQQQRLQLQPVAGHGIHRQQEDLGSVKDEAGNMDGHDGYEDFEQTFGTEKKRKAAWRGQRSTDTDSDQGAVENENDGHQESDDGGNDSGEGEEMAAEGLKDHVKADGRQEKRRRKTVSASRKQQLHLRLPSQIQQPLGPQHTPSSLSASSSSSFTLLSPLSTSPPTSISSSSSLASSSSSSAAVAAAAHCSSNFITEQQFLLLAEDYLLSLSPKKREKALLSNAMYQKILMVLIQPKNTQVSTAQFRFWAKKMFTLSTTPTHHVVCHGGKPVATKECLYDVLVYCHRKSSHGGRDKTSAEVRR